MRVAIVSYYCPPQSAIASHRVLRLSRALLAAGHAVEWVTADTSGFAASFLDDSLAALIPEAVVVHGIAGQALTTKPVAEGLWEKVLRSLAWHLPRRTAHPDAFFGWGRALRRKLPDLVLERRIDAVLLCCGPHSQILVLPVLQKRCPALRCFVDYRDLLTGNPWNQRERRDLERRLLPAAEVLFVNTGQARSTFLAAVGPIDGLPVLVMRNAADFDLAADVLSAGEGLEPGPGTHLGFFGSIFPRRRLRPLLEALAGLEEPLRSRLTLHVYTDAHDSRVRLQEDLVGLPGEVAARVRVAAPLPYRAALRAMRAMDALLLVNGDSAPDAVFVPGKLYDYLMVRRPTLFVGHPGEAGDIVAATSGSQWRCDGADRGRIAACLRRLVAAGRPPDLDVGSGGSEYGLERSFAPLLERLAVRPPG